MLTMIGFALIAHTETNWPFYVAAGLQFPVYCAIWYLASKRVRSRPLVLLPIGVHLAGIAVLFFVLSIVIH